MARKTLTVKHAKRLEKYLKALEVGKKPRYPTRVCHRCPLCGRSRGYLGKFNMCRICFRELASRGLIMGVTKSSW